MKTLILTLTLILITSAFIPSSYGLEYMKNCEPCHLKLLGPDWDIHTIHTQKKTHMQCFGCHGTNFRAGKPGKIVRLAITCEFCHTRKYGYTYTVYAHADRMCIYCHAPENNSNISYPVKNIAVFHDVHLRAKEIKCEMCHADLEYFKEQPTHCYCCHGTDVHAIHNVSKSKITEKCSPCHTFKKPTLTYPKTEEISIKTKIKLGLLDFLNNILKKLYEMIF